MLQGNEPRSLRRVGKPMLSQGRLCPSMEVRSSPPSQPHSCCPRPSASSAGWKPWRRQAGNCLDLSSRRDQRWSCHTVNHQPRPAAGSFTHGGKGWAGSGYSRVHLSPPDGGAFPQRGLCRGPWGAAALLGAQSSRPPQAPKPPGYRQGWEQLHCQAWGDTRLALLGTCKSFHGLESSDPKPSPHAWDNTLKSAQIQKKCPMHVNEG